MLNKNNNTYRKLIDNTEMWEVIEICNSVLYRDIIKHNTNIDYYTDGEGELIKESVYKFASKDEKKII